ncbi:MAG: type I-C CRISPR-associated protein Cas8c/Csd1 [Thaumarchaeota archaeon]|nr:type I-C CRISPR-associated protein Cas8c/Csd1 [Nitrososphaerota archaeon]
MIQELVELSDRLPKGKLSHDALDYAPVSIDCVIDRKGNFKKFIPHDKQSTLGERIAAKKGKARLLVDKPEEFLEFFDKREKSKEKREKQKGQAQSKHKLFRDKLDLYKNIKELSPVFLFYESNKTNGIEKARRAFAEEIDEKQWGSNLAFLLVGENNRVHEQDKIYKAIITNFEASMPGLKNTRFDRCSVCGSITFPVADKPHGMIKGVPGKPMRDRAFVSYNKPAFESYAMVGNENSSICTHCAKAYVNALNWLLSKGSKNRRDISNDTAVVFWLRKADETPLFDILDNPTADSVRALFDSVYKGRKTTVTKLKSNTFYAITLSSASARIVVRDWIETSLENLRTNLVKWFEAIEVLKYDQYEKKLVRLYPRFKSLVFSAKGKRDNNVQYGRIGAVLWKCAVMGQPPPLWLISATLNRIRAEQGNVTPQRAALLQLFVKRTLNKTGVNNMTSNDGKEKNIAYICGQLFAVLENIQYWAGGGDRNAGIRQRFFSFASTMPSTAFGRLIKLSQHHLSKIKGENYGLFVNLDKKLQEQMCEIEGTKFPAVFSLEEQGSFAIGYYRQQQENFTAKTGKKEN